MKILVADDAPSVQDVYDLLMNHWGYEADIVPAGRQALLKAKTDSYDLCVFDIDMPGLNNIVKRR